MLSGVAEERIFLVGNTMINQQSFREFNFLVKHAKAVITDSVGIIEHTAVLGVPCLTLRDNTERSEAVIAGTSELTDVNFGALAPSLDKLFVTQSNKGDIPEKWYSITGERIVDVLKQLLQYC